MLKPILTLLGFVVGALASLMARPSIFGMSPGLDDWLFSRHTIEEGWIWTILPFCAVGLAIGFVVGLLLEKRNAK